MRCEQAVSNPFPSTLLWSEKVLLYKNACPSATITLMNIKENWLTPPPNLLLQLQGKVGAAIFNCFLQHVIQRRSP